LFSLFIGYPFEEWRRAFFFFIQWMCQTPTEDRGPSLRTTRPVAIDLCESEATATMFICAKAKRQQHCLSVRKRSDSNICLSVRKRSDSNNNYAKAKLIYVILGGLLDVF